MQAWTERIVLRHAAAQPRLARLRELQGHDEMAISGVDTRAGVALLDRLLEGGATALSASDRDAALAALHRALWGDAIVASLTCAACGSLYDLSFTLSALQRHLWQGAQSAHVTACRTLDDARGQRWHLPDADAEDSAAQVGLQTGRAQLLASIIGGTEADPEAAGQRLEALAPLLDVDLDAPCSECGHAQQARFDLQSFVLQRLLDEREGLLNEVHGLARAFGWSLQDILSLPRSLRRSLVERLAAAPTFG